MLAGQFSAWLLGSDLSRLAALYIIYAIYTFHTHLQISTRIYKNVSCRSR